MEAAAGPAARTFNRQLFTSFLKPCPTKIPRFYQHRSSPSPIIIRAATAAAPVSFLRINPPRNSRRPIDFFLSLSSSSSSSHLSNSSGNFNAKEDGLFKWHPAPTNTAINGGSRAGGPKDPVAATVVLLGWMGAKQKHLRKYVEWYHSLGIHAITFVVDVGELVGCDLGDRVEKRIAALADELISWVTQRGEEERCLLFHTFSNTGFLTYGYVIDIMLQGRRQLMANKIRGCVVDSGGAGLLNHKVWAAGFAAAILKKRSSAVPPSSEEVTDSQPDLTETLVLGALEKLFSVVLKFPEVDRKLKKIMDAVSDKELSYYPRLYLYSTGDKVVPHEEIEAAIEEEARKGRRVVSYNFETSSHVDHYRAFPETYLSVVHEFVKECFSNVAAAADVKPPRQ